MAGLGQRATLPAGLMKEAASGKLGPLSNKLKRKNPSIYKRFILYFCPVLMRELQTPLM
jgi:hypothetical protein